MNVTLLLLKACCPDYMRSDPRDSQYSRLLRWLFCQSTMPQRAALQ
jgi:hypothetical protein